MSLHDAVLEIADDLEKDALLADNIDSIRTMVKSCVKQLRRACIAVGSAPIGLGQYDGGQGVVLSPAAQHALMIEKAKEEFRKPKSAHMHMGEMQDGGDMVRLIGGPAAPDDVPVYQSIEANMPVGARTMIAGAPYQLVNTDTGRVLLYDEKELQRLGQNQRDGG